MKKDLTIIGRNTLVDFVSHVQGVPAKIDTGADTSAVWATNVEVSKEGVLSFVLFGKSSKYYSGQVIHREAFQVVKVRSSNGHQQIRYRTEIPLVIHGQRLRVKFTLSDRSINNFPVLIGKRTLTGRFLVDVSKKEYDEQAPKDHGLNEIMIQDPHKFHKKYFKKPLLRRR